MAQIGLTHFTILLGKNREVQILMVLLELTPSPRGSRGCHTLDGFSCVLSGGVHAAWHLPGAFEDYPTPTNMDDQSRGSWALETQEDLCDTFDTPALTKKKKQI